MKEAQKQWLEAKYRSSCTKSFKVNATQCKLDMQNEPEAHNYTPQAVSLPCRINNQLKQNSHIEHLVHSALTLTKRAALHS